jgi:heme-degrading monooxygenase HmoA
MATPYTQGIWEVKPRHVDEFVAGWIEFVGWTTSSVEGAGPRTLFRDLGDDRRFVSMGAWRDLDAIERWRSMSGWSDGIAKLRESLVRFEPATLELVADADGRRS